MANLNVILPCFAGGISILTLNVTGTRSGGSDDHCKFRVVRRRTAQSDLILDGEMYFRMTSLTDGRAWNFIDANIPLDGDWAYEVQVNKIVGNGSFDFCQLSGIHLKR